MEDIKLKVEKYQKILAQYIRKLADERNDSIGNDLTYQAIIDLDGKHFQLLELGWEKERYTHTVLVHLDISLKTGNIWVQKNDTEIPLDIELAAYDIPKSHFVLGFRPPYIREHSDFAVA